MFTAISGAMYVVKCFIHSFFRSSYVLSDQLSEHTSHPLSRNIRGNIAALCNFRQHWLPLFDDDVGIGGLLLRSVLQTLQKKVHIRLRCLP